MYYTIYKITNKINNKFYIGKHQTKNLDDGYMGSGKLLNLDIKKYGVENFTKEILFVFDNEQEMNDKEKELVIISEETYNLCEGGKGGFGYINSKNLRPRIEFLNQKRLDKLKTDSEFKKRFSEKNKKIAANAFKGRSHSEETKRKMADGMKAAWAKKK